MLSFVDKILRGLAAALLLLSRLQHITCTPSRCTHDNAMLRMLGLRLKTFDFLKVMPREMLAVLLTSP